MHLVTVVVTITLWFTVAQPGHGFKTALNEREHWLDQPEFPIAIYTRRFRDLIANSHAFIDKTLMIKDFACNVNKVTVINAPVGWGKSVVLDMLKTFFEIPVDERGLEYMPQGDNPSYELFKLGQVTWTNTPGRLKTPLLVSEHDELFHEYQAQYPVIYLDLCHVSSHSFTLIKNKFANAIGNAFAQHEYLMTALAERMDNFNKSMEDRGSIREDLQTFALFLHKQERRKGPLINSLDFLTRLLSQHFKRKVFLFIDDYDTPLQNIVHQSALTEEDARKTANFFTGVYDKTLRKNPNLKKALVTGRLYCGKRSSIVPYNVVSFSYFDNRYHEYFGFAEHQIQWLFDRFNVTYRQRQHAKRWYGGFSTTNSTASLYSPQSLIAFLCGKKFQNYYKPSLNGDLLGTIVVPSLLPVFELLVNDFPLTIPHERLRFAEPELLTLKELAAYSRSGFPTKQRHWDIALGYLCSLGYLTFVVNRPYEDPKQRNGTVKIPNQECALEIANKLINLYERRFLIAREVGEKVVNYFAEFVANNRTTSSRLRNSLQNFICNLTLPLQLNRTDYRSFVRQHMFSVCNYLSLKMRQLHRFETQLANQTGKPDFTMRREDLAVVMQIKYDNGTAAQHLNVAKTYRHIFQAVRAIKRVKFIGVHIAPDRRLEILGELESYDDTARGYSPIPVF